MAYYAGAVAAGALGVILGAPSRPRGYTGPWDSSFSGASRAIGAYNVAYRNREQLQSYIPDYLKIGGKRRKLTQNKDMPPVDMQLDQPYIPQMDEIVQGVAAQSIYIRDGYPKKGDGYMSYYQQYQSNLTLAASDGGAASGQQCTIAMATGLALEEFTGTTRSADEARYIGLNLYTLDPNQLTTGSTFPLVPAPPPNFDPSGPETVTERTIPRQDWINVNTIRWIFDFVNFSNIAAYMTVYICKAKRDLLENEATSDVWQYADQNWRTGQQSAVIGTLAPAATTTNYLPNKFMVHTVPTSSISFNSSWKVMKVQPCMIAASGSCKLKVTIDVGRRYSREIMEKKKVQEVFYPKGSYQILVVGHGAPTRYNMPDPPNPSVPKVIYGAFDVGCIVTKKYSLGFVENKNAKLVSTLAYTDQLRGVSVGSQYVARDGAGVTITTI